MDTSAEHYREEAQHCRELAETLSAMPKEHMLDVARQYDELAEKARKRDSSTVSFDAVVPMVLATGERAGVGNGRKSELAE